MKPLRFAVGVLLLTGCDPTLAKFTASQKPLIEEVARNTPKVAAAVRSATPTDTPCKAPVPLVTAPGATHNTEVLTLGALERAGADHDAYAPWNEVPFGLRAGAPLESVLRDSHPTMAAYRKPDMKVGSKWRAEYDDAGRVAYLVVLRTQGLDREAGTATVDAFLVDWKKAEVLCGFTQALSVGANLGTTGYQVVRESPGKREVVRTDSHDNFQDAMFSQREKVNARAKAAWGVELY